MNISDVGPYIILGIDKDADPATLPEVCARRVEAARAGELTWTEEQIVAALEVLHAPEERLESDVESFNTDIASGEVRRLARLYRVDGGGPAWEPMDPEPPTELTELTFDAAGLAAEAPAPDVPLELPSVETWLTQYAAGASNPWTSELTN